MLQYNKPKKVSKIGLISCTSNFFNFGLRSIEAYLKNLGHEVFIINSVTKEDNPTSLLNSFQLKTLAERCFDCDVVGSSIISAHNLKRAEQVNNYLLENTKAKVILGGVPVILDPHYFLKFADYVCLGEGEVFFEKFLQSEDYSTVPGLGYKAGNGEVVLNSLPPLVNINNLPIPRFDFAKTYLLTEDKITSLAEDPKPLYVCCSRGYRIFSTRGCSFSCTYCANNKLNSIYAESGKIIRSIHPDKVIEELEYAKEIIPNLHQVYIIDDDFAARPKDEFEYLISEYQKKINLPCTFYSKWRTLTEAKLDIILKYKLKVVWLKLGLQSASLRMNKYYYKRPFNKKLFIEKCRLIISNNINLRLDMIFQNPYESVPDWIENLSFFRELGQGIALDRSSPKLILLNQFSLRFYPGTELYDRALNDGMIDRNYVNDVLLIRNKYNVGKMSMYSINMFSIDIVLLSLYYLLIANKANLLYRIFRNPFVLKFINWLCSNSLFKFCYSRFRLHSVFSKIKRRFLG
jgi:radical SAM superfamily enzyme YgiQ (UPF0313 family)